MVCGALNKKKKKKKKEKRESERDERRRIAKSAADREKGKYERRCADRVG